MTNNNNMILYNITINIDSNVANVWLDYMKTKHISDVLKTGLFIECKLCRIHAEEDGGHSYSIQYFLKSLEDYNLYQKNFAEKLQIEHAEKFKGKFAAFRTLLEVIYEEEA